MQGTSKQRNTEKNFLFLDAGIFIAFFCARFSVIDYRLLFREPAKNKMAAVAAGQFQEHCNHGDGGPTESAVCSIIIMTTMNHVISTDVIYTDIVVLVSKNKRDCILSVRQHAKISVSLYLKYHIS